MSQLLDHLNTNELWPRFRSAYCACHSTETALLRILNDLLTAGDDGQVSLLTLLDLSAALTLLTTTSSSIGSNMFSANRTLLFLSSGPILLRESKWYPFLATVQIRPLSFMTYLRAQFSVPFCFYSTHNHSHRLLIDIQFPTVNLPMIASHTIQFNVKNLTRCLVTCSHV